MPLKKIEIKVENQMLLDNDWLPRRATDGSAGYDLFLCRDEPLTLAPGQEYRLKTGFAMSINDPDWCCLFIPRSGLGAKKGIVVANTIGLIDSDFQNECLFPLVNRRTQREGHVVDAENDVASGPITLHPGDRYGQMFFVPVGRPELDVVSKFSTETGRSGGLGSTGA